MVNDKIIIKGAKEHNLKNIDLELPRNKFIVITGISGSGKSSLAFDTIYAEGQRRYVESLSSYARQFLGQMDKPDVEYIEGLSPSISIDQKTTSRNPRSTVGTVTEIYDYLRLLYARIGTPYCYKCGKEISSQTVDQMVDSIMKLEERTRIQVLAPVVRGKKGEHQRVLENIRKEGFIRVIIDDKMYEVTDEIKLEKNKKHDIYIVVDRIIVKEGIEGRLTDSIEIALKLTDGLVMIDVIDGEPMMFSQKLACPDCGVVIEEMSPRMFSFNSPFGACPNCNGIGYHKEIDQELVIPNPDLSINEGGIAPFNTSNKSSYYYQIFKTLAQEHGFDMDTPLKDAPNEFIDELLYGSNRIISFQFKSPYNGLRNYRGKFEGVIPNLERRYRETNSDYIRNWIDEYMAEIPCPTCKGRRLKDEVLAVKINGLNIAEVTDLSITQAIDFFENLKLDKKQQIIGRQVLKEIRERLAFLRDVGLEYLTLSRSAGTLSGGESQRIRLATQIGSSLVGVIYVLDEPSIGLHQRDNAKLLKTLRDLTDLGNTVIVVEHDESTMYNADYIVDIGPGAGIHGGYVVAEGTIEEIKKNPKSITGQYLSGIKSIEIPKERKKPNGNWLEIKGAKENNLKNIDVKIPLGVFTCVTGVSGSGKSTLVNEILYKSLAQRLNGAKVKPGKHKKILGLEHLDKVIVIDQSPIGRTPRSNPATYTGVFDYIREVFAMTPEAKMRGYDKGRFSFNVKGGRCEACKGDGILKVEMHFLPDVYVPCEVCKGKRYNRETLQVKYKGKTIADILDMTVEEALEFFENIPRIKRKLQTLYDVGLGYIKLGQSSTDLSGGEAQRVKLATELSKRSTGKTVYILDEPTTGLHMADIHKLIKVLNQLVEGGNTVIVIEHNLDVIKTADYIIDLGPEGGDKGGTVVATGAPEEIAKVEESYTGQFLKEIL
ncbi:excinuclease ABC subunit A [Keratinibaculum paraultunense]|uniref:UvrABC system protein A n=1 Tax=Keratinibaculum paraultunense TaxID=1278232 RepID=A0A4R3L0U5_9FIRM|nr:excinuclease ABC subunit UvrA [Keratinibaculum paraultunense]QQY80051.1 excinuclease ABC subunit UvrA [Keratinibaculum paraultunense]TCS91628.1 excinuclease ABC subunit A [Keratinibaculum paraultunense]